MPSRGWILLVLALFCGMKEAEMIVVYLTRYFKLMRIENKCTRVHAIANTLLLRALNLAIGQINKELVNERRRKRI